MNGRQNVVFLGAALPDDRWWRTRLRKACPDEGEWAILTHELELLGTPATVGVLPAVAVALKAAVPGLRVAEGKTAVPPRAAMATDRGQWRAGALLDHVTRSGGPRLWIVEGDLYADGLNFVFGLALRARGAVVSTARLPDEGMVVKEALHEAGHVLGLAHCRNACVMQFSNDLPHALAKPSSFCGTCRAKLDRPG